jgi:hypothetical protein
MNAHFKYPQMVTAANAGTQEKETSGRHSSGHHSQPGRGFTDTALTTSRITANLRMRMPLAARAI